MSRIEQDGDAAVWGPQEDPRRRGTSWHQHIEATCGCVVSEQGWVRHGIAEVAEQETGLRGGLLQGVCDKGPGRPASATGEQKDRPGVYTGCLNMQVEALGAGLGECAKAFTTASNRCGFSKAPGTCTPSAPVLPSAVPEFLDHPQQWQGKLSAAVALSTCLLAVSSPGI